MTLRLTGARREAAYAGDDRPGCCTRLQVRHHRHRIGLVLLVASFFAHAGETQVAGDASAAAADAGRSVIIADPFPLELVWVVGGRFRTRPTTGVTIPRAFVRTATPRIRVRSNTIPDLPSIRATTVLSGRPR